MTIRALIFDLDGTAIPKSPNGMPSPAVIQAVTQAQQVCHVSAATGRTYEQSLEILDALNIEDLCIVNGGAQIYSRKKQAPIWKQKMEQSMVCDVFSALSDFTTYEVADDTTQSRVSLTSYQPQQAIALSCIFSATLEDSKKIIEITNRFESIVACPVSSWKEGTFDIHITHEFATKKHALEALLKHWGVTSEETMVVGDGGNDLALFAAAGLKVAMGNAADELKAEADWIAPSVDEDGLAVAIEKCILR